MDFYLQRLRDDISTATMGLTPSDLTRHPEGKWSTAEILEHLYLTYTGTTKGFNRCLEAGKPLARAVSFRDRAKTFVVVGLGYLPGGRTAPKSSVPRGLPTEVVLAEFSAKLGEMDEVIARAERQFGERTRVLDHPILGPLRPQEWRKFHWVHGQHHLKQIRNLRASF